MMEKSQVKGLQLSLEDLGDENKELSTYRNPPSSWKHFPSHCKEATCPIENRLTESGIIEEEIEEDQSIEFDHNTCGNYVSPLTKCI